MQLYPQKRRGLCYGKNTRNEGLYHTVDITCTRTRAEEKAAEILIKIKAKKLLKKANTNGAFTFKNVLTEG